MTWKALLILAVVILPVCAAAQQPMNADWVGIWHASMDGRPTDTLTLAADAGQLGGTIVLDMLSRKGGHAYVIASEPHVLLNPQVNGDTLAFEVKMMRPDGAQVVASFIVTRTPDGKASFHCATCGPNAPTVELTKE